MKRILTNNIFRSADRHPDRAAFKQLNRSITYEQLVAVSNQVAWQLLDLGLQKGQRVGIFMNRAFESSYGVYGVLLAGGVYVPLDTSLPVQRIRDLITDCDIQIVITNDGSANKLADVSHPDLPLQYAIGLDADAQIGIKSFSWDAVLAQKTLNPPIDIQEEDMAYIIYTSGTTGKSKGIVHTHYSGCSYAKLSAELYAIKSSDILGNHSHLHYDISTMGYLTMPLAGGCTVIIPEAHTLFPASLSQLIDTEKMTIWYSVPLALIQLIQSGQVVNDRWPHLRWILYGGEPFALRYIDVLRDALPNVQFSNVYGPAEVNQCTFYNFDQHATLEEPIPIGQAWPETQLAVTDGVDPRSNVDEGELLVSSSTQMKGYWNQPKLTEHKMVVRSDEQVERRRYYKTGDIVRRLPSGDLVFVGRTDRQVKVRGYRVEMNEIESVLLSHSSIDGAAVYATKEADVWRISAVVVVSESALHEAEIKKYLATYLPAYALPSDIQFVDLIPRTSAGKIDYKALTK